MRELLLVVIFAFFVSSAHIDAEDEDSRLKKEISQNHLLDNNVNFLNVYFLNYNLLHHNRKYLN